MNIEYYNIYTKRFQILHSKNKIFFLYKINNYLNIYIYIYI
jgi:hypothetical protein